MENIIKVTDPDNNTTLLSAKIIKDDPQTRIVIAGSIKTRTSAALSDIIMRHLKEASVLVLDFKDVAYIASAGLRVLLTAQQYVDDAEDGTDMIIVNINDEVRGVFESTGFINILNVKE